MSSIEIKTIPFLVPDYIELDLGMDFGKKQDGFSSRRKQVIELCDAPISVINEMADEFKKELLRKAEIGRK